MGVLGRFTQSYNAETNRLQQLRERTQQLANIDNENKMRQDTYNRGLAKDESDHYRAQLDDSDYWTAHDNDPQTITATGVALDNALKRQGYNDHIIPNDPRPKAFAAWTAQKIEQALAEPTMPKAKRQALINAFKQEGIAKFGKALPALVRTSHAQSLLAAAQPAPQETTGLVAKSQSSTPQGAPVANQMPQRDNLSAQTAPNAPKLQDNDAFVAEPNRFDENMKAILPTLPPAPTVEQTLDTMFDAYIPQATGLDSTEFHAALYKLSKGATPEQKLTLYREGVKGDAITEEQLRQMYAQDLAVWNQQVRYGDLKNDGVVAKTGLDNEKAGAVQGELAVKQGGLKVRQDQLQLNRKKYGLDEKKFTEEKSVHEDQSRQGWTHINIQRQQVALTAKALVETTRNHISVKGKSHEEKDAKLTETFKVLLAAGFDPDVLANNAAEAWQLFSNLKNTTRGEIFVYSNGKMDKSDKAWTAIRDFNIANGANSGNDKGPIPSGGGVSSGDVPPAIPQVKGAPQRNTMDPSKFPNFREPGTKPQAKAHKGPDKARAGGITVRIISHSSRPAK